MPENSINKLTHYVKQQSCEIFVADKMKQVRKVRSTETVLYKRFRCDAPFKLVSIDFYKYYATLLLGVLSIINQ